MAVQAGLAASDDWAPRGTCGGITADGQLLGDGISKAGDVDGVEGKEVRQVIANVVDVLKSVEQLVVIGNTITGNKVIYVGEG